MSNTPNRYRLDRSCVTENHVVMSPADVVRTMNELAERVHELEQTPKGHWIEVDGVKDIPIGTWLGKVHRPDRDRTESHVVRVMPNVRLVGGHFHFDVNPVTAYWSIPVDKF